MRTRSGSGGPGRARRAPVRFHKYEGAGNDFVLLDARKEALPALSRASIRRWLDRHRGIGGDGLLVLERSGSGVGVRYFNADGGAAAFCGNGARCVALHLLLDTGQEEVRFRLGRHEVEAGLGAGLKGGGAARGRRPGGPGLSTGAGAGGAIRGPVSGDLSPPYRISLRLPLPRLLPLPDAPLPLPVELRRSILAPVTWIDTGVPHLIVPVGGIASLELGELAAPLRRWAALGPAGSNVDLVEIRGRRVYLRTWERGVEGETLACGSGLAAAAFWAMRTAELRSPVHLVSRGGDRFVYSLDRGGAACRLEGPARCVFSGVLPAP